jgi:hypothetical protein
MDTPDLTEGGTPCGKRYGTKTSISLVKRRISPTKENISIMANSMIQDKSTAPQMRWPGFHDVLHMLAFTRQNMFKNTTQLGFQAQKIVITLNTVFWDVMPCSPVEIYCNLRGMFCLHPQGIRQWHHAVRKKIYPLNVHKTKWHHIISQKRVLTILQKCFKMSYI